MQELTCQGLSNDHYKSLSEGSGISEAVLRARGYRTLEKAADVRRLGFSDTQARVPALLIPVYGTSGALVL